MTSEDSTTTTGPMLCDGQPCPCTAQVVAGANHNCALRNDGSVVCWGRDQHGQLGKGRASGSDPWPHRVPLPADAEIVQIDAGAEHSCAASGDGRAWCWGRNGSGESSPGTKEPVVGPTELLGAPSLERIHTGFRFTCATAEDGRFACWGFNASSQLFDPFASTDFLVSGPHSDDALDGFVLGREHGCLWSSSELWCWGGNGDGQLGSGSVGGESAVPSLVEVDITTASAIASGDRHTCVATNEGVEVRCWGDDHEGQITGSEAGRQPVPTEVSLSAVGAVTLLASRDDTTCAWLDSGDLYCWGGQNGGHLGTDVPNDQVLFPPARVTVADEFPDEPVQLAVGNSHICVRSASERVRCWGRDNFEQLGGIDPIAGQRSVEIDVECE